MTNAEKFEEVFGFVPSNKAMCPRNLVCADECHKCPFNDKWLDREYRSCFKIKEVYNGRN